MPVKDTTQGVSYILGTSKLNEFKKNKKKGIYVLKFIQYKIREPLKIVAVKMAMVNGIWS